MASFAPDRNRRGVPAWVANALAGLSVGVALAATLDTSTAQDRGEPPPGEQTPIPPGTGRLTGVVRYAAGTPVQDVVVYLEPKNASRGFDAPEKPAVMRQQNAQFWPSLLTIARGQTVEFHNDEKEPIEHNVFSRSPIKEFDIGLNPPGVVKTQVFDKVGAVKMFCSIHRLMEGVIYVCPTPFHAAVGIAADEEAGAAERTGGEFKIDGVPPGEYVLKTWQKRKRADDAEIAVSVRADEESKIAVELKRK